MTPAAPKINSLGRQPMADGPARTRNPFDQPPGDHAGRERAEGLVGLEREHGEVVQRRCRTEDLPCGLTVRT